MHLLELGRPKGLESVLAQVWEGSLGHSLIGKDDRPHIQKRNIAAPWLQKTSLLCQSPFVADFPTGHTRFECLKNIRSETPPFYSRSAPLDPTFKGGLHLLAGSASAGWEPRHFQLHLLWSHFYHAHFTGGDTEAEWQIACLC